MTDPVGRHVLRAFALARATGAPALACLAGVGSTPAGTFGLTGAPDRWTAPAGLLEIAVLADLALGASARARAGSDRRMPTLSLTIDLAGSPPPTTRLDVVADEPAIEDGSVSTAGTVRDAGRAIGHCAATFALGSAGFAVLPWEQRFGAVAPPLAEDDLDAAEAAVLTSVRAAGASSWSDAVLDGAITGTGPLRLLASACWRTGRAPCTAGSCSPSPRGPRRRPWTGRSGCVAETSWRPGRPSSTRWADHCSTTVRCERRAS